MVKRMDGDIDNKIGVDGDVGLNIDSGWVIEWMM